MNVDLAPRCTRGASVTPFPDGWRLEIPGGGDGTYRLAQLDDYSRHPRRSFSHSLPLTLRLRARLSAADLPGTWGFGLWNDPFGLALGFGGNAGRLPALPNVAWFFHASAENYLSLGNTPANGFFAGTLRSPSLPSILLAPGLLALPLLVFRPFSRLLRRWAGRIVRQDGAPVKTEVADWHEYCITWQRQSVTFSFDGREILSTTVSPLPPLGLVIWVDNQYAAWRPDGRLGYGTLENSSAWMEINDIKLTAGV